MTNLDKLKNFISKVNPEKVNVFHEEGKLCFEEESSTEELAIDFRTLNNKEAREILLFPFSENNTDGQTCVIHKVKGGSLGLYSYYLEEEDVVKPRGKAKITLLHSLAAIYGAEKTERFLNRNNLLLKDKLRNTGLHYLAEKGQLLQTLEKIKDITNSDLLEKNKINQSPIYFLI